MMKIFPFLTSADISVGLQSEDLLILQAELCRHHFHHTKAEFWSPDLYYIIIKDQWLFIV